MTNTARPKTRTRDAISLQLTYTNHRGETSVRRIIPLDAPHWASTDWHPEPQWLLRAFDVDKKVEREFALKDFVADSASLSCDAAILTARKKALYEAECVADNFGRQHYAAFDAANEIKDEAASRSHAAAANACAEIAAKICALKPEETAR